MDGLNINPVDGRPVALSNGPGQLNLTSRNTFTADLTSSVEGERIIQADLSKLIANSFECHAGSARQTRSTTGTAFVAVIFSSEPSPAPAEVWSAAAA